jgi:hypothetical protein
MLIIIAAALLVQAPGAQTLGSILGQHEIDPRGLLTATELQQPFLNGAVSEAGDSIVLAWYHVADGMLQPPLHVLRYRRARRQLDRAAISEGNGLDPRCVGSVVSVTVRSGLVYVGAHLNPSAGCTLVISPELRLKRALWGWLLGTIGNAYTIVHESQVHFAPLHPARIAVYDVHRNRVTTVYPPKSDRLRQEYARALRANLDLDWCRNHNSPCDPDEFESVVIGEAIVNETAVEFSFEIEFRPTGFGDKAERNVPPRRVLYVFRRRGATWEHRAK